MSEWVSEFRYAARTLARTPGFTGVAIQSLALGIGVNTAVLAVGRAVLFQPLQVRDPGALTIAYHWRGDDVRDVSNINSGGRTDDATGRSLGSIYSYPTYTALRAAVTSHADLFAFTFMRQANISTGGHSSVGGGMLVSGNYFATMGVPMQLGPPPPSPRRPPAPCSSAWSPPTRGASPSEPVCYSSWPSSPA